MKSIKHQIPGNILFIVMLICFSMIQNKLALAGTSAGLDQMRNGKSTSPISPIIWDNGNSNLQNAHLAEGQSQAYRIVFSGLTVGTQYGIVIGYDIKNSGKNAIDYLTYYNRLQPHGYTGHSTAETIDPLAGSGISTSSFTTYAIPAPSSSGSPVSGQPTTSFNALSAAERLMLLYNGSIDTIYYVSQGSLIASSAETQVMVKFKPTASTAVLVFGGHLADRDDWGYSVNNDPMSAGGISGSPFHLHLVGWSDGNIGSQDRSVQADAVFGAINLPVDLISFRGQSDDKEVKLQWVTASEINSDYFMLEKSNDLINFSEVATVRAAGNSTSTQYYHFTDDTKPAAVTYYRLSQYDYDGTRSVYAPIAIKDKSHKLFNGLKVFNSQASLIMQTNLNGISNEDLTGSDMMQLLPDRLALPEGVYFFQYYNENFMVTKRKFISSRNAVN